MRPLAELFPDEDYRFHLTLRREDPREFFRPRDPTGAVLAERRRWLSTDSRRYADLLPEGESVLSEFAAMVAGWGFAGKPLAPEKTLDAERFSPRDGYSALLRLGATLEADVLWLSRDAEGAFRLRGGALCFPTGWALEEKIGHGMDFIHGPVPGLNSALGSPIQQFLGKLKPGMAFLRDNWGLAATNELNLHPARGLPPPSGPVALDHLWLRVEHQALLALPDSGGIVFGIRIALHRLDAVARDAAGAGLRRALQTMPAELAAYKRLDGIRAEVIRLLGHP